MDFPYAIEGGSTIKFFWVLNKLYMAKREAILKLVQSNSLMTSADAYNIEVLIKNFRYVTSCKNILKIIKNTFSP